MCGEKECSQRRGERIPRQCHHISFSPASVSAFVCLSVSLCPSVCRSISLFNCPCLSLSLSLFELIIYLSSIYQSIAAYLQSLFLSLLVSLPVFLLLSLPLLNPLFLLIPFHFLSLSLTFFPVLLPLYLFHH